MTIPEGVTSIGSNAFHGCSGLTNLIVPESVHTVGEYAFSGCGIILSDEFSFDVNDENLRGAKIYVNRGKPSLWKLWTSTNNYIYDRIYEIGTGLSLARPKLSAESTQTTIRVFISNYCDGYDYTINGQATNEVNISGLNPETVNNFTLRVYWGTTFFKESESFGTKSLGMSISTKK